MQNQIHKRARPDLTGQGASQNQGGGIDSGKYNSLCNARADFVNAITNAGIAVTEQDRINASGDIVRFHVDGDKRGTRNGWAVLFIDAHGAGGAFGHWRTDTHGTWHGRRGKLTQVQRVRVSAAVHAAKAQRIAQGQKDAQAAQARAYAIWNNAGSATNRHPYLLRKGVNPYDLRQRGDLLLIPAFDADGVLWTLQFIAPDGSKRFLSGGRKRGHFHQINEIHNKVLIAEGYATAASLYESTSTPTVMAFDAGNLLPVAQALRDKYPRTEIVVCADNDTATPGNPGLTKANEAALAVRGKVAVPPHDFNDFNDWALAEVTR